MVKIAIGSKSLIKTVGYLGKEKILVYLAKVETLGGIFNFSVLFFLCLPPILPPIFISRAPDFFHHDRRLFDAPKIQNRLYKIKTQNAGFRVVFASPGEVFFTIGCAAGRVLGKARIRNCWMWGWVRVIFHDRRGRQAGSAKRWRRGWRPLFTIGVRSEGWFGGEARIRN